jgi:oxygen-independent coproporphyrinogen III oxidase
MQLSCLAKPLPRYTSYPTAVEWEAIAPSDFTTFLQEAESPLGLYIHLPFCRSLCAYCGCASIVTKDEEKKARYARTVLREIEMCSSLIRDKRVEAIHFGGGSPTYFDEEAFIAIFKKLQECFSIDPGAEIAIEADPMSATREKLELLFRLGFTRLSFGVQDLSQEVLNASFRPQKKEDVYRAYSAARNFGFSSINFDLIYGLPRQSLDSFRKTCEEVVTLAPDRIALFSFAYLPEQKKHQKKISPHLLPTVEEKFQLYTMAKELFCDAGYSSIGLDHFALPGDELLEAERQGALFRNFQGYTARATKTLLGFGMTAISSNTRSFMQNRKDLDAYCKAIEGGSFATARGKILSDEDKRRQFVIERLMCYFAVDKEEFQNHFGINFDEHFSKERDELQKSFPFVKEDKKRLFVEESGKMFIRNAASFFDAFLPQSKSNFSSSI